MTTKPIDPELFARTAPQWNCVDYPGDGPHYTPGTGSCAWCGKTTEQITAEYRIAIGGVTVAEVRKIDIDKETA